MLRTVCSSSCSSIPVQNICWRQLLEGRGNMFITAVDELATGDVICDLLRLPQLPGQRSLPSCQHFKGEHVYILLLGWVFLGQVLGHRVSLVIRSDFLLMRINPSMCRETRLAPIFHGADTADPGVMCNVVP